MFEFSYVGRGRTVAQPGTGPETWEADLDDVVRVRRAALGGRLRQLRTSRDLSQRKLAEAAGVDRSFYASVETGKSSPRVDWLFEVAVALGVHITEFFQEPQGPEEKPAT
jgi:DNA-binding XRE family transcriptional regulator